MSNTAAVRITAAERRRQAMDLRRRGESFEGIARALECSKTTAFNHVTKALAELDEETRAGAATLRALEADRLDALQVSIWDLAIGGDLTAVDRLLKIMERRARLLGLDAPTKHTATSLDGEEERMPGLLVLPAEIQDVTEWVQAFAPLNAPEVNG